MSERVFAHRVNGRRHVTCDPNEALLWESCADLLVEVTGLSDRQVERLLAKERESRPPVVVEAIEPAVEEEKARVIEEAGETGD